MRLEKLFVLCVEQNKLLKKNMKKKKINIKMDTRNSKNAENSTTSNLHKLLHNLKKGRTYQEVKNVLHY